MHNYQTGLNTLGQVKILKGGYKPAHKDGGPLASAVNGLPVTMAVKTEHLSN